MLVDTFEEGGVGNEEATEGGDDGLLFGKGVGAVHSFSDHGKKNLVSYRAHWCVFQPLTKPSRVSSPIVGADNSVRTASTTTSSRLTPKSPRYRIEPSTPIASGSFAALSVNVPSQHQVFRNRNIGRNTSIFIEQFI